MVLDEKEVDEGSQKYIQTILQTAPPGATAPAAPASAAPAAAAKPK